MATVAPNVDEECWPNRRAFVALVIACAAALAATLWAWGLPLSNDGPTYVFQAWVWNHYDDPAYDYARSYELLQPVTAGGFFEIQRALEPVFGWQTAWRLNVILCAELWAFGFFFFVATLAPSRRFAGLLGFALTLQASLWYGLMPYLLGTALGWWTLGSWLRIKSPMRKHVAATCLLTAAAYCHVVPAALTGLTLVLVVAATEPRGRWPRAFAALVVVGAPALWIAVRASGVTIAGAADPEWAPLADRLLCGGSWFQSGPIWRAALVTGLVGAGIVAAARRVRAARASALERALLLWSLVLLLASASMPMDIAGWQGAGIRGLPLGAGIALAFLPVDATRRAFALAARLSLSIYLASSLAWALWLHTEMRARNAFALAALDASPSPADRVSMPLVQTGNDLPIPRMQPLRNIGSLYAVVLGGVEHYGHLGYEQIHHLKIKDGVDRPVPNVNMWGAVASLTGPDRSSAVRTLLARSSSLDGIVLTGTADDIALAKASGFVPEHESAGLLIARFDGCDGQLVLEGADAPLSISLGWWPSRTPTQLVDYAPGPDAPTTMALPSFGCGEVWMTVATRDGARCAGIEPGMPVRASFSRGAANVLACRLDRQTSTP